MPIRLGWCRRLPRPAGAIANARRITLLRQCRKSLPRNSSEAGNHCSQRAGFFAETVALAEGQANTAIVCRPIITGAPTALHIAIA